MVKTKQLAIKEFNSVSNTLQNNFDNILAFFNNRNTNASTESFNSKIKLFRANLRGVTDTKFFCLASTSFLHNPQKINVSHLVGEALGIL